MKPMIVVYLCSDFIRILLTFFIVKLQKLMAEMHKGIHGLITEYDKNIYQELLYHYVRLKQGIMASPRNPYKHNALLREKVCESNKFYEYF